MRDIKFRGKRVDNGEWVYGNLVYMHGIDEEWTTGIQMYSGEGFRPWATVNIDPATVGQFGLHDRNGKEIYEGDIVTAWSQGVCGKFQVKWREDGGGTPCLLLYPTWQHGQTWSLAASREADGKVYDRGIEVIGNVHEHPHLLGRADPGDQG